MSSLVSMPKETVKGFVRFFGKKEWAGNATDEKIRELNNLTGAWCNRLERGIDNLSQENFFLLLCLDRINQNSDVEDFPLLVNVGNFTEICKVLMNYFKADPSRIMEIDRLSDADFVSAVKKAFMDCLKKSGLDDDCQGVFREKVLGGEGLREELGLRQVVSNHFYYAMFDLEEVLRGSMWDLDKDEVETMVFKSEMRRKIFGVDFSRFSRMEKFQKALKDDNFKRWAAEVCRREMEDRYNSDLQSGVIKIDVMVYVLTGNEWESEVHRHAGIEKIFTRAKGVAEKADKRRKGVKERIRKRDEKRWKEREKRRKDAEERRKEGEKAREGRNEGRRALQKRRRKESEELKRLRRKKD